MSITARLLGQPFMPWQQYVADVIGEVDPKTGIRIYREAYLTCMRQVGKTTFVIVLKATTALDTPKPVTIQFAAQEGKSAVIKMIEHAELVKSTPLGRMLDPGAPSKNNNNPHVRWTNGSVEKPLNSNEESGHGDSIALGAITEAMAHKDDRYIQAMQPAMKTNPNAQLFVESTQGNARSIYWNEQTAELRERFVAEDGQLGRVAFFDWSFADDEDPFAESTWRRRIPSLGHTLRLEEVQHEASQATTPKKIRAFKRGTGNIADLGLGEGALFNEDYWQDTETNDIIVGLRALTFDVTNDRSWASLAWAGVNRAGDMQSELIKHERAPHWVVAEAGAIFDRNPKMRRRIYCVAGGQAPTLEDAFTRAGIELVVLNRADYAGAAGEYFDGCGNAEEFAADEDPAPRVFHTGREGQGPLHVAIAGATWTKEKGPRIWDSVRSTTVISPLVACSIAPWAYQVELEAQPVEDLLQTFA